MTDAEREADLEAEFRKLLEETPIHRRRWRAVLVALVVIPSLLTGFGWWYTNRQSCHAVNRATDKVEHLIDGLTTPVTYAPGAGTPLRVQTDAANRVRAVVRTQAHETLADEQC